VATLAINWAYLSRRRLPLEFRSVAGSVGAALVGPGDGPMSGIWRLEL
jgi:hypothetical protein